MIGAGEEKAGEVAEQIAEKLVSELLQELETSRAADFS